MNTTLKTSLYAAAGTVLSTQATLSAFAGSTSSSAADATTTFGTAKAGTVTGKVENAPLSEAVQGYVNFFMTFLYLIAVMYALWGGFQILTAGGDDKKVSAGKTILIQAGLGLLVIWLSGTIISWVLSVLVS